MPKRTGTQRPLTCESLRESRILQHQPPPALMGNMPYSTLGDPHPRPYWGGASPNFR